MSIFNCSEPYEGLLAPQPGQPINVRKDIPKKMLQEQQKTLQSIASKALSHAAKAQYYMCVYMCPSAAQYIIYTPVHLSHLTSSLLFATKVRHKDNYTTHTQIFLHTASPLMSLGKGISRPPLLFPNTVLPVHPFAKLMYYILQTGENRREENRREEKAYKIK